jgi:hypothetical protein
MLKSLVPSSPTPFHFQQARQAIVESIFRCLDKVQVQTHLQGRARIHHILGDSYVDLSMWCRSIAMYRESLNCRKSKEVSVKLALLLINLYGEQAFAEAR